MAVPAGLGWTVPLPKLDFSGRLDAWPGPRRLAGLAARAGAPRAIGHAAGWSDGAGAVQRRGARRRPRGQRHLCHQRPVARLVAVDRRGGADRLGGNQDGKVRRNPRSVQHGECRTTPRAIRCRRMGPGCRQPAARQPAIPPGPRSSPPSRPPTGARWCGWLRPSEPRLLSYQLRNWMGMLLAEGRLAVPASAERVVVPAPTAIPRR